MYFFSKKMIEKLNSLNSQEVQKFNKTLQFFMKNCAINNHSEPNGIEKSIFDKHCEYYYSVNQFINDYCVLIKNTDFKYFNGKNYYILNSDFFIWIKK